MFDIGWSEMAIIAFVALIVIGPKELPRTMKTVAQWMRKARSLTREFQSGIDDIVREAELEDARKALDATRGGNLKRTISNAIDPEGEVAGEVTGVERAARSDPEAPARGAPEAAARGKQSNAERAAAKMVTAPANVAPPHSLQPPAASQQIAPEAAPKATPEAAGEKAPEPQPAAGRDTKQSA